MVDGKRQADERPAGDGRRALSKNRRQIPQVTDLKVLDDRRLVTRMNAPARLFQ
jgi:hypothetical protein